METVAGIVRPYIYRTTMILLGLLPLVSLLNIRYAVFDIDIDGLRLLAASTSTIVGILIGILIATVATIVRVSIAQKQFYQGVLASESQWLGKWFASNPTPDAPVSEVRQVLYAIYRHSTTPEVSDDELIDKIANTLLPLPYEWRKMVIDASDDCHLEEDAIDEFEMHVVGMGATLSQINASKDRMEVGASLGRALWLLGFVLFLGLMLILCCAIPNIANLIGDIAFPLALGLIAITLISVLSMISIASAYLTAEAKEIRRVVKIP